MIRKKEKKSKNSSIWKVIYKEKNADDFIELVGQKGYWYADPMLLCYNNSIYMFTEAFNNKRQIGHIAVSTYDGRYFSKPTVIIKQKYHLSYPCIFEYNKRLYMIPESSQNGTLELWEAYDSVYKWKKKKDLLSQVRLADATIVKDKNNNLYIIAYDEYEKYCTYIYSLDMNAFQVSLLTKIENKKNNKRPAGKWINCNQSIYRPVQNNIKNYGENIIINEVLSINPFKEREVCEIFGGNFDDIYNGKRTHTLCFENNIVVADILDEAYLPFWQRITLIRKFRNKYFRIKFILKNLRGKKYD